MCNQHHPAIRQARANLDVAKLETEKAIAGHKPTVDFTLGYNVQKNFNGTNVTTFQGFTTQATIKSAGITATLPLYATIEKMDEAEIRRRLDACLVPAADFTPRLWEGLPDPFPAWGVREMA